MQPERTKKHWTEDEIDYVRSASAAHTSREIARHLNRPLAGVQKAAHKHGIKFMVERMADGSERKRWTQPEVTRLWGLAEMHSMRATAKLLGRTYQSVKRKSDKLGVSFRERRMTIGDVAELLGVADATVTRRRNKLGLRFRTTGQNGLYGYGQTRGARGSDIVAIAQDMLDDPPRGRELKRSAKFLRQVIQDYQDWE